jgi:hypothetical protein
MLTIQGAMPTQLKQVSYTQMPERDKLLKIARLYANAFADLPWNEFKVCPEGHYFGRQQAELTSCTNCSQPLKLAYPEEETADYITKEISKVEGTLITFEEENGGVFAAGWGYVCSAEDLRAKYNSSEMKEKVVGRIWRTAEKVERVFYLSEIMVDASVRKQGIATKIAKDLVVKAQSLKLNSVMRTRIDSPMVYIANNMQMAQVISMGEDKDNENRVLFLKKGQDNG